MNRKLIQRIRQGMAEKKMSQADLARSAGIRPSSLSDYLTGKYSPKHDKIERIAAALQVSPAWLLGSSAAFSITEDERLLLEQFRQLPPQDQEKFRQFLRRRLKKT